MPHLRRDRRGCIGTLLGPCHESMLEVAVYRYQFHVQVQMGAWGDFRALLDELNTNLRAKGLVPFQPWETAFGRFNEILLIAEYETLEAYEREHFALHADAACMDLWRRMTAQTDGIPWTDLWWTPPEAV